MAGPAVGGVLPGARQPGDDRGAAAADDQREPGGQLADHVRGGHVVAAGVVLAADLPGRLPAQLGRRVQGGDVGDAGQEHLHRAGVQDDLAAVLAPPSGQLRLAVHHGDHLDALAAGVRQPERQRDGADLGDLVQAHQQRRVQPPGRRGLADLGGGVVDLGGHRGEQRRDRGFFGDGVRDHVHGARLAQERGDVEAFAGAGQDAGGQRRVGHERQGAGHDHADGGGGLVRLAVEFGQGESPLVGAGGGQDLLGDLRVGAGHPRGDGAQVLAGQGGGVEVAAQVVTGLGGPEGAVLDAFLGDGERERIRAADRGGRVLASGDRGPAEGGTGPADALGVEHVHRAGLGAHAAGEGEDIGLGGGGDDRAGVAQDHIGQERGLEGAGRGHHQQVLFQRDPQPVPVVRPAQEHRVLPRIAHPVPPAGGSGGCGPSGAARPGGPSAATG